MLVNGKHVEGIKIAFNDCHKIYVCKDWKEVKEAREKGYSIYPISELPGIWKFSCPMRFISKWDLTEYYVQQCEEAEFESEKDVIFRFAVNYRKTRKQDSYRVVNDNNEYVIETYLPHFRRWDRVYNREAPSFATLGELMASKEFKILFTYREK